MTSHKWLLLVEDNALDADLVKRALASSHPNIEAVVATDGSLALDCLYQRGSFESRTVSLPTMVLLDLKMPKVDGMEVLRQIKSDDRLKSIPTVVFTSSREEQDVLRSYQLGANAFVVKPVEFQQFSATLQGLCVFWMTINEPPPVEFRQNPCSPAQVGTAA